jgi:hypothetical protein
MIRREKIEEVYIQDDGKKAFFCKTGSTKDKKIESYR